MFTTRDALPLWRLPLGGERRVEALSLPRDSSGAEPGFLALHKSWPGAAGITRVRPHGREGRGGGELPLPLGAVPPHRPASLPPFLATTPSPHARHKQVGATQHQLFSLNPFHHPVRHRCSSPVAVALMLQHRSNGTNAVTPMLRAPCNRADAMAPVQWSHCSGTDALVLMQWQQCRALVPMQWH